MTEPLLLSASDPKSITRVVAALRAGQVVAFPTDTVYGLGAHSGLAEAIEQLYQIKGREHQKAIPLLLARTEDVSAVARDVPDLAWRLAARFWPGPVTLVLLGAATLLDVLTAGAPTVAVRVPAHPLALRLISALGVPLATTSANLSGQPEAVTAQEVWAALGARVALVLDGGRCPGGVASTLVDVTTAPPTIRRRGALVAEVEAFLS
jgi:L-threonylcarbamoyladenylate synthase